MNTEKAKYLNAYFLASLKVFNDALLQPSIVETEIDGKIVHFCQVEFDTYYNNFLVELEEVMKQVRDVHISYDYASGCLNDIKNWKGFPENQNKVIFSKGTEINFLITLKNDIETFARKVTEFCRRDKNGDYGDEFYSFYFKVLITCGTEEVIKETKEEMIRIERNNSDRIFNYYKFDLEDLKRKCDKLPNTVSKLNFMQDQLYDFKFMVLQSERNTYIQNKISVTPDYETLCLLEIDRYTKKLELEMKVLTVQKIESLQSMPPALVTPYSWNASVTDLIELVAALHKENIIERKNKKELTRKELIAYFSGLFDLQMKDVEVKLTKATSRYDKTPFLDRLKQAFENFGLEKEEKQRKRR
ncbi:MAG: RteC domain-containing protein [Paludibacter sp.]|nr:RteC domain-containing protein [Paludibacter sp.]